MTQIETAGKFYLQRLKYPTMTLHLSKYVKNMLWCLSMRMGNPYHFTGITTHKILWISQKCQTEDSQTERTGISLIKLWDTLMCSHWASSTGLFYTCPETVFSSAVAKRSLSYSFLLRPDIFFCFSLRSVPQNKTPNKKTQRLQLQKLRPAPIFCLPESHHTTETHYLYLQSSTADSTCHIGPVILT